jgi:hypothetical protein
MKLKFSIELLVSSSDSISVIFQLFPKEARQFFHQSDIIEHSESFSDFGMNDNDRIVVFPT